MFPIFQVYSTLLVSVFLIGLCIVLILLLDFFRTKAMEVPEKLFSEALYYENEGLFEKAETYYRSALEEMKGKKLQSRKLKNKIDAKIKLLHTVIVYQESGNAAV
jgi:hypothetical protein